MVPGGVDQTANLFETQPRGQPYRTSRVGHVDSQIETSECLDEKEPQSRNDLW